MASTVASVALTQPSSDPNIDEAQTYTQGGQVTFASHGGADYDMHFQYDQGSGSWTDIPLSGGLSTADTNPIVNITDAVEYTITVTGSTEDVYEVRIQTVDHGDSENVDTSGTQTVTVNAGAPGGRRRSLTT